MWYTCRHRHKRRQRQHKTTETDKETIKQTDKDGQKLRTSYTVESTGQEDVREKDEETQQLTKTRMERANTRITTH